MLWAEAWRILDALNEQGGAGVATFREIAEHCDQTSDRWKRWLVVRGDLCLLYQSVVYSIANTVAKRLPKLATTCFEEVVSMGQVGLLEAIDAFNRTRNVRFTSFCGQRVRGAILDELRRLDHLPRRAREMFRRTGEEPPLMLYDQEPALAVVPASSDADAEDDEEKMVSLTRSPDVILRNFSSTLRPIARMLLVDRMSFDEIRASTPRSCTARLNRVQDRLRELAGVN